MTVLMLMLTTMGYGLHGDDGNEITEKPMITI